MYSRKHIVTGQVLAHVFFRCHNREFLLAPTIIKNRFLALISKYKDLYGIEIFEFNLMDNHIHLLVKPASAEALGNFMRTVNSLLARYINKFHNRDSQAIRERYKSPMVTTNIYLVRVIQYIWMNRYKATGMRPENDPYCSASWRLNERMIDRITSDPDERKALRKLLSSYSKLSLPIKGSVKHFIRSTIEKAIVEIKELTAKIFEHGHTIADQNVIAYRSELLTASRREYVPWTPPPPS